MVDIKPIWKSKTFYLGVLLPLSIVLLTELENFLSTGQAITAMAVLGLILRAVTKSGMTFK